MKTFVALKVSPTSFNCVKFIDIIIREENILTNKEYLNLMPTDEQSAWIYQKLDEYILNKDVTGCIAFLSKELKCDENTAMHLYLILTDQEETECDLTPQQIAHNNEVAREWQNKPKCQICGSTNIKRISTTAKVVNTAMFGIFGNKRKYQWHCNNCNSDF